MEADFQREYGIDLSVPGTLMAMSWRRFMLLVRGLGPNSATQQSLWLRNFDHTRTPSGEQVEVVEGPAAVMASLGAALGGGAPS